MQLFNTFVLALAALLPIANALIAPAVHPRDFPNISPRTPNTFTVTNVADECHAHGNVCAEFFIGDRVSQVFRTNQNGCTVIVNPSAVTAVKIHDCWCGLWWATSTTACNNGNDERVDSISQCMGRVTPRERGWKKMPTHVGCYRS